MDILSSRLEPFEELVRTVETESLEYSDKYEPE